MLPSSLTAIRRGKVARRLWCANGQVPDRFDPHEGRFSIVQITASRLLVWQLIGPDRRRREVGGRLPGSTMRVGERFPLHGAVSFGGKAMKAVWPYLARFQTLLAGLSSVIKARMQGSILISKVQQQNAAYGAPCSIRAVNKWATRSRHKCR
jgi:hypothetical protein